MRVLQIWRFPVKSLQGEQVDSIEVEPQGLAGDRRLALFDTGTGFGLTARRHPELLHAGAATAADGSITITLPDGSVAADDTALSDWLHRPVALRSAAEPGARRYENPADFEDETGAWEPFDGATGAFQDSDRANVSFLGEATIGDWDRRRFRANVLLSGGGEDDLVGRPVEVGNAAFEVRMRIARCVMVTRPQPGGIDKDLDVLRRVHRERDGCVAIGAVVTGTGTIRVGDELRGR